MFIIDFRNKLVSDYRFSVIGNSNVDKVDLVSHFTQYANYSIYLKVVSDDERYVDKIAIASENISVDEDVLVCRWTMGAVSTQCKKLYLQLQFEQGDTIIAQSRIVSVVLGDTINVDELLPVIYPQVLKELQNQIDTLKSKSFALASMSYLNDVLYLSFENALHEIVSSVQVAIPTSDKLLFIEGANLKTLAELFTLTQGKVFMTNDMEIVKVVQSGSSYNVNIWDSNAYGYKNNQSGSEILGDVEYTYTAYVKQRTNADIVYGNDHSGNQTHFSVDHGSNFGGKVVRRDSDDQIYVPLTPTQNGQATSKKYVDDKIEEYKELSYQDVDITEYPTLNDFLASEGEKGYLYLYPINTSEAPTFQSGYYRYVWENDAWKYLGTTEIDLSGYYTKSESLIPNANDFYDLGSSINKWHDLYLGGTAYVGSLATDTIKDSSAGTRITLSTSGYAYFNAHTLPNANNTRDLGSSTYKWKDLYLSGVIYGATYSESLDEIYTTINNLNEASANDEIKWSKMLTFSKSADTTFTLETPKTNCLNEYKAIITNSGNSAIVLTFTGITHILCNDDNIVVVNGTNSTLTLPSGITIEINALNNNLVAINFEAQ